MTDASCTLESLQTRGRWLSAHARNVESQCGEDGMLEHILSLLPERTHWCVEFGAWDGKHLSNTFNLMSTNPSRRVVLIEPHPTRFRDLQQHYPFRDRATFLNSFVGFTEQDSLDVLLAKTAIPQQYDLLSIDIDGNDYHVWNATTRYRPSVVIIEYNPTMSNSLVYVQPKDGRSAQGASPRALVELGRRKGYELIATTSLNLIFVRQEYLQLFGIPDNSLAVMRDDSGCPQIAVGQDGTLVLRHLGREGLALMWHGVWLGEGHAQVLPRGLRRTQD